MKIGKRELLSIVSLTLVALALRLYRIPEYLTFLGDEGRDVRIVRDLLHGNLVFIGPQTSIGNMYLGPLYYYMMAPALFLSRLDPTGPAVMVALLSVITIIFTWWVARHWFGPSAAFIAALLFSLSPVAIIYSHSSWNPNPIPFFALLSIFSLYQVWQKQRFRWLIVAGISLAFALQMHYLGLLLLPVLGTFWLAALFQIKSDKNKLKSFLICSLLAVSCFLLLMSPLVLFDLKHQGMNFHAFKAFFSDRQTTVNVNPANSDRFWVVATKVTQDLLFGQSKPVLPVATAALLLLFVPLLWYFKFLSPPLLITSLWFLTGIFGLGLYKQHVYAHYFGFLFPVVFLLSGWIISRLLHSKSILASLPGLALLVAILYFSLTQSPLKFPPNRQLQVTETAVDLVIKESGGQPFNFGLIAKQNYDESYRYFFENKHSLLTRSEDKITDQLFVICEDGDKCQPEGHPQWQIAAFGPSTTVSTWNVNHLKIYKLVHKAIN